MQVFMGTTSCLSSMLVSSTPALEGAGVAIDRSGLPTATQFGKAINLPCRGGGGGSTQRATLGKVMVAARAASPCPRSAPSTSYSASCATIPIGLRRLVAEPRADAQPLNAAAALHPRWPPDW